MSALTRVDLAVRDPAVAEARLRSRGAPSRIAVARADDAAPRFGVTSRFDADADLALARFGVQGAWSVASELDLYVVMAGSGGSVRWETPDDRGAVGWPPVLLPPGAVAVHVDAAAEVSTIAFTRQALMRAAAAHWGVEHVRLSAAPGSLRNRRQADYWQQVLQYTRNLLDAGLLQDELLLAALKRNLAVTLLETFSPIAERREWRLPAGETRRRYLAARDLLEERAGQPITADDVAAAVGLPFDVLDRCFVLQAGVPVEEHLRRTRLDAAHAELVRAEPRRAVAAAIARRWGFPSLDGFLDLHARLHPDWDLRLQD